MQVELCFLKSDLCSQFFTCSCQSGKTGTRNLFGLNLFKILALKCVDFVLLVCFFPRRGNTGKGNGDWNIRGQLANCLPGKSQFFYQWQEIGRASKSSCGELEKLVSGHQTQPGQTSEHHSIRCLPTAGGPQPYLDQMSSVWGISMLYNCGFVVGLVSLYMEVLWVPHSSMLRSRTLL